MFVAPAAHPSRRSRRQSGSGRVALFDGIRGIAIVLVIIAHMWTVWVPWKTSPVWRTIVGAGDYGVNVFFVIGAFLATGGMLREVDRTTNLRFGVTILRRWVRLSAHLYPLLIAVLAFTGLDRGKPAFTAEQTGQSVWRIATYTWNNYLISDSLMARPDLGHLWYLTTDLWVIALIAVVVYVLRRNRPALLAVLVCLAVVTEFYRQHVYVTDGAYTALLQIPCRADAPLLGAAAAVALPYLRPSNLAGRWLLLVVALAQVPLAWSVSSVGGYFAVLPTLAVNLSLAAFVILASVATPLAALRTTLGAAPLRFLGRNSPGIYLWHYPVFWWIARNDFEWSQPRRFITGLVVTAVIAVGMTHLIERPLQRWLRSDFWVRLTQLGLLPGSWAAFRSWVSPDGAVDGPSSGPR